MIDPKDLKEFTGIEAENADDFKAKFNERYVLKDKAAEDPIIKSKVSGAILGSEMTNFYRRAKEEGIEFDAEEKKTIAKNEDLFDTVLKKFKDKLTGTYVNQIAELEKKAASGNDDRIKALEDEKAKIAKSLEETKSAWKQTAKELEDTRKDGETKLKQFQVNNFLAEAEKGVKFKQKMSEAERLGYEAAKKERLKFELNEQANGIDTFNSKGERMISKQKAGDFLNATEALQDLANELGLAEVNPHGGKPAPGATFTNRQTQPAAPAGEQGKTMLIRGKVVKV